MIQYLGGNNDIEMMIAINHYRICRINPNYRGTFNNHQEHAHHWPCVFKDSKKAFTRICFMLCNTITDRVYHENMHAIYI